MSAREGIEFAAVGDSQLLGLYTHVQYPADTLCICIPSSHRKALGLNVMKFVRRVRTLGNFDSTFFFIKERTKSYLGSNKIVLPRKESSVVGGTCEAELLLY